jgi:hypothetical protein
MILLVSVHDYASAGTRVVVSKMVLHHITDMSDILLLYPTGHLEGSGIV